MDRLQTLALGIGVAGLAAFGAGYATMHNPEGAMRSYLLAFLFWVGLSLGSLGLLMLHHMVGGGWGLIIRRMLEAASRTLPLMVIFSIPVFLSLPSLYIWARPEVVAKDKLLQHKALYLNPSFFIGRTLFYFAVWMLFSILLNKWSADQDKTGDPSILDRMRSLSGPGILVYGLTVTFAAIDWAMSLEPHWFSTAFGALFIIGQVLSTLALVNIGVMLLAETKPISDVITKQRLNDLGNLMLAFVMLWAYISFSQFLIIWSGNLPEEISWYQDRLKGGYGAVAVFLLLFHFAVPFLILLSRKVKRRAKFLGMVASALFVIRLVDIFWMVSPVEGSHGIHFTWLDIAAPIGMGGIWLAAFIWQLKGRPLVPLNDPQLKAGVAHE
jgi:hypothetical protein